MFQEFIDAGVIDPLALDAVLRDGGQVKLLDASFVLPASDVDPLAEFGKKRIDGARFFDIKKAADASSPLPHMLPAPEVFAAFVAELGVSSDDFVVVYAQSGMVMGPARVWWMFRIFGHERVCVLNGGLPAWEAAGLPVNTDAPDSMVDRGDFQAAFRPELVVGLAQMKEFSQGGLACICDARPAERFSGAVPEPRPGMRAGHIPGSMNVPCSALVDSGSGMLRSDEEIRGAFAAAGLDFERPIVTTCGSGVTACFLALCLFKIGYKNVPVYDGSWSEWGLEATDTPVAV